MNKIKNTLRRHKYIAKHDLFSVENVVLILAIILCLTWTYQSVLAMSKNWELTERLSTEKRELELLNIEVEATELENSYYKTPEYQELLARKHLDKKLPGENLVIMPENTAAAKTKHQQEDSTPKPIAERSNFEKWLLYLSPKY